jgi:hypothetical protein
MMCFSLAFRVTSDRLLRELSELDFAGSSDSDSSNSINYRDVLSKKSKLYQASQDLRDAARAHPNPPSEIYIRFTRLLPHLGISDLSEQLDIESSSTKLSKDDRFIVAQLHRLADLGIRVKLGPAPHNTQQPIPSTQAPGRILSPTRDINLDLSLLVALCSDITHAPLPASEGDALRRFPTLSRRQRHATKGGQHKYGADKPQNLEKGEDGMDTAPDVDPGVNVGLSDSHLSEHARSLAAQAMQESRSSLIDEIHRRCYSAPFSSSPIAHFYSSTGISEYSSPDHMVQFRFWTTREAKDRFLAIVDKIGGPIEKLRAQALFQEELEVNFWKSSRYPVKYIPDLIPIRLHEDYTTSRNSQFPADETTNLERSDPQLGNHFRIRLRETCLDLLSSGISPTAAPAPVTRETNTTIPFDTHKRASSPWSTPALIPASALKIGPSARSGITPHTLRSLLFGVSDTSMMMTTLTANRSSIDTVLRRMKILFHAPLPTSPVEPQRISLHMKPRCHISALDITAVQQAVVWIVEPRSLAEGMRSDSGGDVHHVA